MYINYAHIYIICIIINISALLLHILKINQKKTLCCCVLSGERWVSRASFESRILLRKRWIQRRSRSPKPNLCRRRKCRRSWSSMNSSPLLRKIFGNASQTSNIIVVVITNFHFKKWEIKTEKWSIWYCWLINLQV